MINDGVRKSREDPVSRAGRIGYTDSGLQERNGMLVQLHVYGIASDVRGGAWAM